MTYRNELSFEYRTENLYYDNYDYYSSYRGAVETADASAERVNGFSENQVYTSVRFGAGCANLVETLNELGIIDDTWKLMTNEEYDGTQQ